MGPHIGRGPCRDRGSGRVTVTVHGRVERGTPFDPDNIAAALVRLHRGTNEGVEIHFTDGATASGTPEARGNFDIYHVIIAACDSLAEPRQRTVRAFRQPAAKVMAEDAPPSLIGRQLGSYMVLSLLGAGGMGEVYRARDTKLDRDVAIKILPDAFARDPTGWRASDGKPRPSPRSTTRTSSPSSPSRNTMLFRS